MASSVYKILPSIEKSEKPWKYENFMILKALYGIAVQLAHWKSEKKWRVPTIRNVSSDGQYKTASNCDSESFF